jgi:hypothetical protein
MKGLRRSPLWIPSSMPERITDEKMMRYSLSGVYIRSVCAATVTDS